MQPASLIGAWICHRLRRGGRLKVAEDPSGRRRRRRGRGRLALGPAPYFDGSKLSKTLAISQPRRNLPPLFFQVLNHHRTPILSDERLRLPDLIASHRRQRLSPGRWQRSAGTIGRIEIAVEGARHLSDVAGLAVSIGVSRGIRSSRLPSLFCKRQGQGSGC